MTFNENETVSKQLNESEDSEDGVTNPEAASSDYNDGNQPEANVLIINEAGAAECPEDIINRGENQIEVEKEAEDKLECWKTVFDVNGESVTIFALDESDNAENMGVVENICSTSLIDREGERATIYALDESDNEVKTAVESILSTSLTDREGESITIYALDESDEVNIEALENLRSTSLMDREDDDVTVCDVDESDEEIRLEVIGSIRSTSLIDTEGENVTIYAVDESEDEVNTEAVENIPWTSFVDREGENQPIYDEKMGKEAEDEWVKSILDGEARVRHPKVARKIETEQGCSKDVVEGDGTTATYEDDVSSNILSSTEDQDNWMRCPQCGFTFRKIRHYSTYGENSFGLQLSDCPICMDHPLHDVIIEKAAEDECNEVIFDGDGTFVLHEAYVGHNIYPPTEDLDRHRKMDLNKQNLQQSVEKPFKCNECGKTFRRTDQVKTHMTVHTHERPHICSICGKALKYKSTLKSHMRYHYGQRKFVCPICQNTFLRKDHLNLHMRVHFNEKPYQCTYCFFSTKHNRNLITHIKKCHPK